MKRFTVNIDRFIPNWSILLGLRSNGLLRVSQFGLICVPLLADIWYVLQKVNVALPFPASWVTAFVVSLTIFLGNAFVDAFCPGEIKRYVSQEAYQVAILSFYAQSLEYRSYVERASERRIDDWIAAGCDGLEAVIPGWESMMSTPEHRLALINALSKTAVANSPGIVAIDDILVRFGAWPDLLKKYRAARVAAMAIYIVGGALTLVFGTLSAVPTIGALGWKILSACGG